MLYVLLILMYAAGMIAGAARATQTVSFTTVAVPSREELGVDNELVGRLSQTDEVVKMFRQWKNSAGTTTGVEYTKDGIGSSTTSTDTASAKLCGVDRLSPASKDTYSLKHDRVKTLKNSPESSMWVAVTHALLRCTGFAMAVLQHYQAQDMTLALDDTKAIHRMFHQYYDKNSPSEVEFPSCLRRAAKLSLKDTLGDVTFETVISAWFRALLRCEPSLEDVVNRMFKVREAAPFYHLHFPLSVTTTDARRKDSNGDDNNNNNTTAGGGGGAKMGGPTRALLKNALVKAPVGAAPRDIGGGAVSAAQLLKAAEALEKKDASQKKKTTGPRKKTFFLQGLVEKMRQSGQVLRPCYLITTASVVRTTAAEANSNQRVQVQLKVSPGKPLWQLSLPDRPFLLRALVFVNSERATQNSQLDPPQRTLDVFLPRRANYTPFASNMADFFVNTEGSQKNLPTDSSSQASEGQVYDVDSAMFIWDTKPDIVS
jgi:hypothetical protein